MSRGRLCNGGGVLVGVSGVFGSCEVLLLLVCLLIHRAKYKVCNVGSIPLVLLRNILRGKAGGDFKLRIT